MARKRFIVELGTGVDLHGEDVTEAACRAVKDAISSNCLCGLMEIVDLKDPGQMEVEVLIATPRPEEVDTVQVASMLPFGKTSVTSVQGGMAAQGLCVPQIAPDCDQIIVANAAVTVFINQ
ncbi:MAG: Lin0512 family protein [Proteobacteria bacterium]|nr:Lin0512 family protein [Pseudomonadota bacterium]